MTSAKALLSRHHKAAGLSVLVLALLGTLVVSLMFTTLSRYEQENTAPARSTLEEFYAVPRLYLNEGGEKTELYLSENENGKRYYDVDVEDFDKLSMDIVYQGKAKTYLRFSFDMNWYHIRDGRKELMLHHYPDFTYDPELVFDHQQKDNYFYIKSIMDTGTDEETVFHIFTAMKDNGDLNDPIASSDSSEKLRIYITIDCVQFNRAKALWHMSQFPWE